LAEAGTSGSSGSSGSSGTSGSGTSGSSGSSGTSGDDILTPNRQTASYTLALTDAGKIVEMNVASANNLTVPQNSSIAFATGTQVMVAQYGAGQTTLVADTNVTIRSANGALKTRAQYSGVTLVKVATNEWYAFGDLTI
jgi:hypothetical protein